MSETDPYEKYRKMYPRLDIDQEYKAAKARCDEQGTTLGRKYFEGWLKVADGDYLPPPKPKPTPPRTPNTWEP